MARKDVSTLTRKATSRVILSGRGYSLNEPAVAICRENVERSGAAAKKSDGADDCAVAYLDFFDCVAKAWTRSADEFTRGSSESEMPNDAVTA